MKKGLAFLVAVTILISGIWIMPLGAKAGTYSDEPLVFGVEYLSMIGSDSFANRWNEYDLIVPADGAVTIWGVNDTDIGDGWYWEVDQLNEHGLWDKIYGDYHCGSYQDTVVLQAGQKYCLCINTESRSQGVRFQCNYTFTPAIGIKAVSRKAGTVHVTFPGSRGIKGYQVKYKEKGTKEWKTEAIESTKTLNTEITGLKSDTRYYVKVRAWTEDDYGHRYFSKWTKSKRVKVK